MCQDCDIDLSVNERLRAKNRVFKAENFILQTRLYEFDQVNQKQEVNQRKLNSQLSKIQMLKETVDNYKDVFTRQQNAFEATKNERALLSQTLSMKARNHEATQRSLKQERVNIQNVIRFLDFIEISRRANLDENASIDTI